MEKVRNFLDKVLKKPEEKLSILNRSVLIVLSAMSIYYGLRTMFKGREVMIYEPYYGLVYTEQKSFLGGLAIIFVGIFGAYVLSLFIESFLELVKNSRKDEVKLVVEPVVEQLTEEIAEDIKTDEDTATREAMIKYYTQIPTIGRKMAEKLYDTFGTNLGAAVRENQFDVVNIKGLSKKSVDEIYKFFYGENNNGGN